MLNLNSKIKKLFFNDAQVKTFYISRLKTTDIKESVILSSGKVTIDVSNTHGMICLDPFCVAVWLSHEQIGSIDIQKLTLLFMKGSLTNAVVAGNLIEGVPTENGQLLLYKITGVKNRHFTALHRLALFGYLLKSQANTFYSRKVISALYSYPRNVIIVSYQDANYCNIFPMDIHCYLEKEGLYILGLRTTNVTLDKILEAKKVVVCDTDTVDTETVYKLGKHSSKSPTALADMPFSINPSEQFGFPVPDFTGSYKEIEIIYNRKMGYHMLMLGKVLNHVKLKANPSSLYHIGFLEYQGSDYGSVDGLY